MLYEVITIGKLKQVLVGLGYNVVESQTVAKSITGTVIAAGLPQNNPLIEPHSSEIQKATEAVLIKKTGENLLVATGSDATGAMYASYNFV